MRDLRNDTSPKTTLERHKSSEKKPDRGRYVKVARLGKVSIYRRGRTYWVYFRDKGRTVRKKIDGNLAVARATASQVNVHLEQGQTSPFSFQTKPNYANSQGFHRTLQRCSRFENRKRQTLQSST